VSNYEERSLNFKTNF